MTSSWTVQNTGISCGMRTSHFMDRKTPYFPLTVNYKMTAVRLLCSAPRWEKDYRISVMVKGNVGWRQDQCDGKVRCVVETGSM